MSPPAAGSNAFVLVLLLGLVHCSPGREEPVPKTEAGPAASSDLGGTTWQLVKFEGGDETTLTPDDPAKYTIAFQSDGRLSARIDCNRGMGTWKSSGRPSSSSDRSRSHARCVLPARCMIRSSSSGRMYAPT